GVSAGHLNCFDKTGKLIDHIALPMKAPTMPCFGGDDMTTLFITSLSHNHTPEDFIDYPLSGAVIAIKTNKQGVTIPSFNADRNI
nr:SMP-30/gluconolactonase/LRE family protein [Alphaproteobacteria bacterium]